MDIEKIAEMIFFFGFGIWDFFFGGFGFWILGFVICFLGYWDFGDYRDIWVLS